MFLNLTVNPFFYKFFYHFFHNLFSYIYKCLKIYELNVIKKIKKDSRKLIKEFAKDIQSLSIEEKEKK